MRFLKLIAFFTLLSSNSLALADYRWGYGDGKSYPSAKEACDAYLAFRKESSPYATRVEMVFLYDYMVRCDVYSQVPPNPEAITWTINAQRSGTPCEDPKVYDPSTGGCVAPQSDPCEPTIGQYTPHEHEFRNLTEDGNPDSDPPVSICDNFCQYTLDFGRFSVRRDKDSFFGTFNYKGNGVTCTGGDPSNGNSNFDQPPQQPPQTEEKEYIDESSCDSWVTNADGTTSRSCLSRNYFNEPGNMNCGSVNGVYDCTPGNPPPYEKDQVTEKTDIKTNNPDGSSTTTSESSTTTTTCKGLSKCTSTGKNETSTEGTNADGTEGDKSSTCTGEGCESSEGEEGEEEKEEEPERTAGNTTCNGATAVVSCSGDAIDCAVLQEQANQSCMAKEQADFPGKKGDIEGLVQGEQFTLQETTITAPSFINTATRFLPSGCPAPETAALSSNGGHTFSFSYAPICQFASDMSFLIVAIASIWAAVYVGRAFGGE